MGEQQESTEVKRLQELIQNFTADQLAYLAVRPFVRWDKEAAKEIGIAPETVSRWENKADVDAAVLLMRMDGVAVAGEILRRQMPLAAREIAEQLTSARINIRYRAATEILDRAMGKAKQRSEISGPDGGPIETKDVDGLTDKERIARIAALLKAQQDE